jgi:hypothetical protein
MVRQPSLEHENNIVRCKALRNIPEVIIVGYKFDAVEENRDFNTYYWVARQLIQNGLAELVKETLTTNEWTQIHFKERINPAGPPGPIPDDFYEKAYQSFTSARDNNEPESLQNRMKARFRDILESRINRITRQATSQADSPTRVLQPSETALYNEVHRIVSRWRDTMQELGVE